MPLHGVSTIPAETLIQSIPSILLVFDREAKVLTWNIPAADALGIDDTNPQRSISSELEKAVTTCIGMAKPMRVDECHIEVDGRARIFGFSASPLATDEEIVGALVTARDITERVAISRQMEELKNRAGLDKVALQLSNQFRKPLTSIKGHAQYIELLFPEGDPSIHYAKVISEEVDRMDKMLVGLRDLGRAHELELTLASPESSIDKACELIAPYVEAKGINFTCDMGQLPHIIHDPSMMVSAYINLLKNAVEAADFGGNVLFRSATGPDGALIVEVMDDGPGIDEAIRPKIFDIFFSGEDSSGEGIGLAVSREIAINHHGELNLVEVAGWSTCFRLEVPSQ